jgi:hypothetical protein
MICEMSWAASVPNLVQQKYRGIFMASTTLDCLLSFSAWSVGKREFHLPREPTWRTVQES